MKTRKNKKGISLIVLVITIIVMIILAAAIIISISNSGIVNRANEAVDETNEKQMKELVSLAWAEAYLKDTTETKDDAYFYDEVIAYLKGSGITDEELAKYDITADKNGADANLKTMALNEYGFYYDQLYLGKMTIDGEEFEVGYVFHSNEAVDSYASGEYVNIATGIDDFVDEDVLLCLDATDVLGAETKYENRQVTITSDNEDGTVSTNTFTFSEDGKTVTNTNGNVIAQIVSKNFHGIYYNRVYSGSFEIGDTKASARISIDNSQKLTYSVTLNGTTSEGTAILTNETANGHILMFDNGEELSVYVAIDGKTVMFASEFPLTLTDEVVEDTDANTPSEDTGIAHNGTIPEGGVYYVGVTSTTLGDYTGATATFTAGQSFPATVNTGDVYVYGDYEYRYNMGWLWMWGETSGVEGLEEYTGWGVRVLDATKASYGDMLSSINNEWVSFVVGTFGTCESLTVSPKLPSNAKVLHVAYSGCTKLEEAPIIPNTVVNMMQTFNGCVKLKTAPIIPDSVTNLEGTFINCTELTTVLSISKNVKNMYQTFENCTSLETAPAIPSSVTSLEYTFKGCTNLLAVPDLSNVINVTNMDSTFAGCEKITTPPDLTNLTKLEKMSSTFDRCVALKTAPIIPESVTEMSRTFADCVELETAPTIPSKVTDVRGLFYNCINLTGDVEINSSPMEYNSGSCFAGTVKPIKITGACTTKSVLAATATNGNVTY